jgi:hypothetical protein
LHLFGAMVVSEIYQSAIERGQAVATNDNVKSKQEADIADCYLYIDEFHKIRSEALHATMVMQVSASSVQLVRTGELSMCVITQYIDAKIARSAQQRIAHIRSQAASEFPMKITSTLGGEEFGGG